jgi:hypothetical protein
MMHGHEKSDSAIVAGKPTNKSGPDRSGAGGANGGGSLASSALLFLTAFPIPFGTASSATSIAGIYRDDLASLHIEIPYRSVWFFRLSITATQAARAAVFIVSDTKTKVAVQASRTGGVKASPSPCSRVQRSA